MGELIKHKDDDRLLKFKQPRTGKIFYSIAGIKFHVPEISRSTDKGDEGRLIFFFLSKWTGLGLVFRLCV